MDQVLFDLKIGLCKITTTHRFRTSIGYPSTSNARISKSTEDIKIIFLCFACILTQFLEHLNSQLHCDSEILAAATYINNSFIYTRLLFHLHWTT